MLLLGTTMIEHQEFIFGLVVAVVPILLPKVNQQLAKLTGNSYVKKGFAVAELLKDGLSIDEVTETLVKAKLNRML